MLQEVWGVPAKERDGLVGPDTWGYMIDYYARQWSGAENDRRLDYPSITIKQFQRNLNAGKI